MTELHEHCWHTESSVVYTISPNQRREVCCYCGVKQLIPPDRPVIPDGHGAFYPQPQGKPWGYWGLPEDAAYEKES